MAPPIYVKGGAWTNIEDEILKAAVSKYGLNQWSRVASLLAKKSAKQAKARWNEWLNPAVAKNAWTKAEDEKLLNLVKLLPNQWRTIAPVMGRTATHCVERYQKLLDDAAGNTVEDTELSLSGPGLESLPATGAQVGDVNVNPESKPARPHEDDLDDEEREMLAEAKARLANTQGKKAKRKSRERMLEESKRIALLQKRRELKAAGINISLQSRKAQKEFDYNGDIPHEHTPQAGLYDVSEETSQNQLEKIKFSKEVSQKGISMAEVDEKHKKDKKREREQEKRDDKTAKLSLQAAAEEYNEFEQELLKRRKLDLPEVSAGSEQNEAIPDVDERILAKTRELIAKQATKSTLLLDDTVKAAVPKNEVTKSAKIKKARVTKSPIVEILKEKFGQLPKPRHEFGIIIPSYEPSEETLNLELEEDLVDQGERLRNLEILRQVSEEKAKVRRSQAIQRGLGVPHPEILDKYSEPKSELGKLIHQELVGLICSDYRRFEDASFKAALVEDLDEESYEKVNIEIQKELLKSETQKTKIDTFKLSESFEVASDAIAKLHENHNKSIKSQEKLARETKLDEYEGNRSRLLHEINDTFYELADAENELLIISEAAKVEEISIASRGKRLQEMVDSLVEVEHRIEDKIRNLRRNQTVSS